MPSKNKKTLVADSKTDKKARSFLSVHDEKQFKWAIRSDKIDCQHNLFGFNADVQKSFIEKIKPTLDAYASMKWSEVIKRKSCHYFDVIDLDKILQDRVYELFGDFAPETLFQIQLSAKHRIFGYDENGIFYIIFNDFEHNGCKVHKTHT